MKITKSQPKQIIKEELSVEEEIRTIKKEPEWEAFESIACGGGIGNSKPGAYYLLSRRPSYDGLPFGDPKSLPRAVFITLSNLSRNLLISARANDILRPYIDKIVEIGEKSGGDQRYDRPEKRDDPNYKWATFIQYGDWMDEAMK
jgi:hypothetical protein